MTDSSTSFYCFYYYFTAALQVLPVLPSVCPSDVSTSGVQPRSNLSAWPCDSRSRVCCFRIIGLHTTDDHGNGILSGNGNLMRIHGNGNWWQNSEGKGEGMGNNLYGKGIIIIIIIKRIYTRRLKAEVTRRRSFNQSNKCVNAETFICRLSWSIAISAQFTLEMHTDCCA